MREYMEPFGVVTGVNVHLHEEGEVSFKIHPDQDRAVISLETTAVRFDLFVNRENLHRVGQVIGEAEAELSAATNQAA